MPSVITNISVRDEDNISGKQYTCANVWINSTPLHIDVVSEQTIRFLFCLALENKNADICFYSKRFKSLAEDVLKNEKFKSLNVVFD